MFKQCAIIIFSLGLLIAGFSFSQVTSPNPNLPAKIQQAEQLYAEREDLSKVETAINLLNEVLTEDPKSFEAATRLAEYYYFLGKRAPQSQRLDILQHGIDVSRKVIELQPGRPDGYFWLATNLGIYGETKGLFSSMGQRKEVRANFQKAAQLDETFYGGGPLRGLGRWDYRVPGWLGGDKKRSAQELQRALQIAPGNSLTKLYLAETLLDLGKKQEARKQLEEILTMTPDPRWAVEHKENLQEAKGLLQKHFKK